MTTDRAGPKGPITVWTDFGYDGWQWEDFPSLRVAIIAGISRNAVITQVIDLAEHVSEPAKPAGDPK